MNPIKQRIRKQASACVVDLNPHVFGGASNAQSKTEAQGCLTRVSKFEEKFLDKWRKMGGRALIREWQFDPDRKWRFDFANLDTSTAIEIEGAVWSQGRHTRGSGFIADCEKYNRANALGWHVYRLTNELITEDQLRQIMEAMK